MTLKNSLFILFILGFSFSSLAQSERKITRKGNSQYETGNFVDAEINYKKAIEKNADLLEAEFNLGDALMKQERFDEALEAFEKVSSTTENPTLKAKALHNKGNVLLSQQDLEGALESYKDALRLNPKDNETRYNYAYVKKQLEQQQEQEQEQDEENNDENKDDQDQKEDNKDKGDQKNEDSENQDQENSDEKEQDKKEDQKDKGENKEDESKQDQKDKGQTDGEDSDEEKKGEKPQPKENKLSPEEAQRLLEALKQEEDKVQEKMKKHKIKGAKVKIEKDW